MKFSIRSNYDKNGKCVRCPACHGKEFKEEITSTIEYTVCENYVICCTCGREVNYWAYGYYDPYYKINDPSLEMLLVRLKSKLFHRSLF